VLLGDDEKGDLWPKKSKESKRQALVGSLKYLTPEIRDFKEREARRRRVRERPDFVWHLLLQSFAPLVVPGVMRG
jgi:hypothetical protein